ACCRRLLVSSRRRHTRLVSDWSSDVCSSDLCVYTYDWTDQADVRRVRDQLRQLGITDPIPYKADHDTLAGHYTNRGHKKISKYRSEERRVGKGGRCRRCPCAIKRKGQSAR